MLYRVSLTAKHDRFSVPQLGYLGYQMDSRARRLEALKPSARNCQMFSHDRTWRWWQSTPAFSGLSPS